MGDHPGNSIEQREVEPMMLALLGDKLGVQLQPHRLRTPGKQSLAIDGWHDDPLVLCEAWAHQGLAKSAQTDKVMKDAFKLIFAERAVGKPARKILLFGCADAASCFETGWKAEALTAFGIELLVVDLAADMRERIRAAQTRQFR